MHHIKFTTHCTQYHCCTKNVEGTCGEGHSSRISAVSWQAEKNFVPVRLPCLWVYCSQAGPSIKNGEEVAAIRLLESYLSNRRSAPGPAVKYDL